MVVSTSEKKKLILSHTEPQRRGGLRTQPKWKRSPDRFKIRNNIAPALLRTHGHHPDRQNEHDLLHPRQRHEPPRRAYDEPPLCGDEPRQRQPRRTSEKNVRRQVQRQIPLSAPFVFMPHIIPNPRTLRNRSNRRTPRPLPEQLAALGLDLALLALAQLRHLRGNLLQNALDLLEFQENRTSRSFFHLILKVG